MTAAIRVEGLGKVYPLDRGKGRGPYRTLRETLSDVAAYPLRWGRGGAGRREQFWALRDVSFGVESGEVVGLIGRNGAGKSTLLKILSRVTRPTVGQALLHGRVGSLLEVGTGFHPELTGRENVYLNGAILGMSRREIARRFDEIVSFAGVEKFLDTPVKRYSSGMYVRLAFAVAAHLEPEILLVDEVLAVGDHAFQKKCVGRMGEIAASGRTVILVSHNLPMLTRLSTRVVWLKDGQVEQTGAPRDVVKAYCAEAVGGDSGSASVSLVDHPGRVSGKRPCLRRLTLRDGAGTATCSFGVGESLVLEVELGGVEGRSDTGVVIDLCDVFGTTLARLHSRVQSFLDLTSLTAGAVVCTVPDLRFLPGEYSVNVGVADHSEFLDRVENAVRFAVEPTDPYRTGLLPQSGLLALRTTWEAASAETDLSAAPGCEGLPCDVAGRAGEVA
ncbi:MAG TPA: ABC transporter ATP-binding protein [Gemmataceae bacterium]|nr:ABC transporter ATP-binding protein [Gemmataceae bacterium]